MHNHTFFILHILLTTLFGDMDHQLVLLVLVIFCLFEYIYDIYIYINI